MRSGWRDQKARLSSALTDREDKYDFRTMFGVAPNHSVHDDSLDRSIRRSGVMLSV